MQRGGVFELKGKNQGFIGVLPVRKERRRKCLGTKRSWGRCAGKIEDQVSAWGLRTCQKTGKKQKKVVSEKSGKKRKLLEALGLEKRDGEKDAGAEGGRWGGGGG